MRSHSIFVFASVLLGLASLAQAQRRDGDAAEAVLLAKLPAAVRFGATVVAPGEYRLTLTQGAFALAEPRSRVVVATIAVQEAANGVTVDRPVVKVSDEGSKISVVLKHLDRIYTARGEKTAAPATAKTAVVLAGKSEVAIEGGGSEALTEQQAVDGFLKRFGKDIVHCADKALRSGWGTDDERYSKCACPLTSKWRLPKVTEPLTAHHVLVKGRAGISLLVQKDGRVGDCRVWVGAAPPKEPETAAAPSPPPESSPVPAAASGPAPAAASGAKQ